MALRFRETCPLWKGSDRMCQVRGHRWSVQMPIMYKIGGDADHLFTARGTSEPGQFGTVVGDPLIARVIRDMGKDVRGYPVQVCPIAILAHLQALAHRFF